MKTDVEGIKNLKKNLQLREEEARTDVALPPIASNAPSIFEIELEKLISESGFEGLDVGLSKIPTSAGVNINKKFKDFIEEMVPEAMSLLRNALENYGLDAKLSWNDLRDWDKYVPCSHKGCSELVLNSKAVNNEKLWAEAYNLVHKIFLEFEVNNIALIDEIMCYDERKINWKKLERPLTALSIINLVYKRK